MTADYKKRVIFFVLFDILLSIATILFSHHLAFLEVDIFFIVLMTLWNLFCIYLFKGYTIIWRYFSLLETKDIILALSLSHFSLFIVSYLFTELSTRVIIINFAFYLLATILLRFSKRIYLEILKYNQQEKKPCLVIIGLSHITQSLIKDYKKAYVIKAIIDDENTLKNNYIANIKIYPFAHLTHILETLPNRHQHKIIIAKPFEPSIINQIFIEAHRLNILDIQMVKTSKNDSYQIQDVAVEDLLSRTPQDIDRAKSAHFIKDKVLLITGAGGSIGSQIALQCLEFGAKQILLLDHSEYNLYKIGEQFAQRDRGDTPYELILKTVIDQESLRAVFEAFEIDILIHAAAYKHVHLVEENPKEAIINNIIGTKNCIDLSIEYRLSNVVLVSTDKAIRPTNIMGATKRVCELYAQNVAAGDTTICAVRFGNVLDSSGSVIPKFKKQIANNKPLTVTHPEVTRYFMLISEACLLTLQAASLARGKEIFILDMGEPIKIRDLATKMLELYKKEHLGISFIGLRKGEKLYEELLLDESDKQTQYESIIIAKETHLSMEQLTAKIDTLIESDQPIEELKGIVPEFEHHSLK